MNGSNNAIKSDDGKVRMDLLPPDALREIAKVFTYGAKKYSVNNWCNGFEWHRVYAALQRHLNAFWAGEDYDESGNLHLACAGCNILMLISHQLRNIGKDDRPLSSEGEPEERFHVSPFIDEDKDDKEEIKVEEPKLSSIINDNVDATIILETLQKDPRCTSMSIKYYGRMYTAYIMPSKAVKGYFVHIFDDISKQCAHSYFSKKKVNKNDVLSELQKKAKNQQLSFEELKEEEPAVSPILNDFKEKNASKKVYMNDSVEFKCFDPIFKKVIEVHADVVYTKDENGERYDYAYFDKSTNDLILQTYSPQKRSTEQIIDFYIEMRNTEPTPLCTKDSPSSKENLSFEVEALHNNYTYIKSSNDAFKFNCINRMKIGNGKNSYLMDVYYVVQSDKHHKYIIKWYCKEHDDYDSLVLSSQEPLSVMELIKCITDF